jgi:hypothetical protein
VTALRFAGIAIAKPNRGMEMIRHQVKRLTGVSISKDRRTSIIHFDEGSDLVEIELRTAELQRALQEIAKVLRSDVAAPRARISPGNGRPG